MSASKQAERIAHLKRENAALIRELRKAHRLLQGACALLPDEKLSRQIGAMLQQCDETGVCPTWPRGRARKEALALRERVRARLEERRHRPAVPVSPPPRYDDVFIEGVKWLDNLGGAAESWPRGKR